VFQPELIVSMNISPADFREVELPEAGHANIESKVKRMLFHTKESRQNTAKRAWQEEWGQEKVRRFQQKWGAGQSGCCPDDDAPTKE